MVWLYEHLVASDLRQVSVNAPNYTLSFNLRPGYLHKNNKLTTSNVYLPSKFADLCIGITRFLLSAVNNE